MNHLIGYGQAQEPVGVLGRLSAWWSGKSLFEKVAYAVGGAAVVAGVAMVVAPKKKYKANKSKSRKRRKAHANPKKTQTEAQKAERRRKDYLRDLGQAITDANLALRRAPGMGISRPAIAQSEADLREAMAARMRGEFTEASRLLEQAKARVGLVMPSPELKMPKGFSPYVEVEAISESGKPYKRQRLASQMVEGTGYVLRAESAPRAAERERLRIDANELERAARQTVAQAQMMGREKALVEQQARAAIAAGDDVAGERLMVKHKTLSAALSGKIKFANDLMFEHQRVLARLDKMTPNAARISAEERAELMKTAEGRAKIREMREAAEAESAEVQQAVAGASAAAAAERFAALRGKGASATVPATRRSARDYELLAAQAALEGKFTELRGGVVVGEGEKRRRAPTTAGTRGAQKQKVRAGGGRAVVTAARIAASQQEFGDVMGLGITGPAVQFTRRLSEKWPTVRRIYGEAPEGLRGGYKLINMPLTETMTEVIQQAAGESEKAFEDRAWSGSYTLLPQGSDPSAPRRAMREYTQAKVEIIEQQPKETISDFKRRALDAGFTPLAPPRDADGEIDNTVPRRAIRTASFEYRTVPIQPWETGGKKMKRVRQQQVAPRSFEMYGLPPSGWSTGGKLGDIEGFFAPMEKVFPKKPQGGGLLRPEFVDIWTGELAAPRGAEARELARPIGYERATGYGGLPSVELERMGTAAGFAEGQTMDPTSMRASRWRNLRVNRRKEPFLWGYKRGLVRALSQARFMSRGFEPSSTSKGKYGAFPRGYTTEAEEFEGEIVSGAGAVPARGEGEFFVPSSVTFRKNRRRKTKRGRRAA